jgi:hypothetical protein
VLVTVDRHAVAVSLVLLRIRVPVLNVVLFDVVAEKAAHVPAVEALPSRRVQHSTNQPRRRRDPAVAATATVIASGSAVMPGPKSFHRCPDRGD